MNAEEFYDLPTDRQIQAQEHLARAALEHWDIGEIDELTLLAERENVVFDVRAGGDRVVARVHRAGYHSDAELRSQRDWMHALRTEGVVATPDWIPTADGMPFVVVDVAEVPEPRQVSVLEFAEGDQLADRLSTATSGELRESYRQLGTLMARLHLHGSRWERPDDFTCIRWDADGLVGAEPLWGSFWDLDGMATADRATMAAFRDRARAELATVGDAPEGFGLVHNDFLPENLLVTPTGLCLLDFDDSGDGWFLFDISPALVSIATREDYPELREAFFDGYRGVRSLDDADLEWMALFFAVRMATYAGWLDTRRHTQFARDLGPIIIEAAVDVCRRYLSGDLDV